MSKRRRQPPELPELPEVRSSNNPANKSRGQMDLLRTDHVDEAQGYLFARPLDPGSSRLSSSFPCDWLDVSHPNRPPQKVGSSHLSKLSSATPPFAMWSVWAPPSTVRARPVGFSPSMRRDKDAPMSSPPERQLPSIERSSQDNVLTLEDLWLRCFALGTMNTLVQVEKFLRGEKFPTRHEYNLIAVALNEWLVDAGVSPIVPYVEDEMLGARVPSLNASWTVSGAIPVVVSWRSQ
jgi:hypothetical protein